VSFVEGDPDRPIIVGRVYNDDNMPPYSLPDNATQSGFLTRSTKDGNASTANEFRFEDKKGSEEIYLHAEKDQNISVENCETHSVGVDRAKSIGQDETTDVGRDRTETVGRDETISIGVNREETVGKNETISIGHDRNETVGNNEIITITKNKSETIGSDETLSVGGDRSKSIGVSETISIGKNLTITVGGKETLTISKDLSESIDGKHQSTVKKEYQVKAKKIQFEAKDEISFKTGKAEIIMKKKWRHHHKGQENYSEGFG